MKEMNRRPIILLALLFLSVPAATAIGGSLPVDVGPIKPSVSVSFARQVIKENDSVKIDLWMVNDSDYQLINVEMHVAGPDFFQWHEESCEGRIFQEAIALGSIEAHSVLRHQLCVKTTSLIKVGEFNNLFTFTYQWKTNKGLATSLVTYEKTIKSSIFGSDNVAGIPLAFAGFVVPGLFFWFVIHLFGAPWNVGVGVGDKLVYSILVSILIVGAVEWFSLIEISNGISVNKLIRLALIGSVLGVMVGSADYLLRLARRRRAAEKEIALGEDEQMLLMKLLKLNPQVEPSQAIVRLKNGEKYIGSLVSHTGAITSLIGWYKIDLDAQPQAVVKKMKTLERDGQLIGLFELAKRNGIEVQVDDAIQQQRDDELENTGDGSRQWDNGEVAGITVEADGNSKLPLRLA